MKAVRHVCPRLRLTSKSCASFLTFRWILGYLRPSAGSYHRRYPLSGHPRLADRYRHCAAIQTRKWHMVMARLVRNPRPLSSLFVAQFFLRVRRSAVGAPPGFHTCAPKHRPSVKRAQATTLPARSSPSLLAHQSAPGPNVCSYKPRQLVIATSAIANFILLCVGIGPASAWQGLSLLSSSPASSCP